VTDSQWHTFLTQYSLELLADDRLLQRANVENAAREAKWLGCPPASEAQISAAEDRLQRELPPSLRSFYRVTNGWLLAGYSVFGIQPVEQIDWMSRSQPQLFEMLKSDLDDHPDPNVPPYPDPDSDAEFWYEQGVRVRRSLVLNRLGADALWLLDPETRRVDGEWAGGRFAAWEPGMKWYATSFAQLMIEERRTFLEIREHQRHEAVPGTGR
jgi:hypothetical protein